MIIKSIGSRFLVASRVKKGICVSQTRWCHAKQAEAGQAHAQEAEPDQPPPGMSDEELEQMREQQRWQDRYEFSDEEIEEELRSERAYTERYRELRNWLRYHFNIFEEHDNLTERREKWGLANWRDLRVQKLVIAFCVGLALIYTDVLRQKFAKKAAEFQARGAGAEWPTHYIALKEIIEGKRELAELLELWTIIRDSHQRDWLLALLMGQALMNQVSDPPILSLPNPSNAVVDRLSENLAFIEPDVSRVSAEVALHLYNLQCGDVKWPGRPPNAAVMAEIKQCVECMANFRIHPMLQERLAEQRNKENTYYGGNGYFKSSTEELTSQQISSR